VYTLLASGDSDTATLTLATNTVEGGLALGGTGSTGGNGLGGGLAIQAAASATGDGSTISGNTSQGGLSSNGGSASQGIGGVYSLGSFSDVATRILHNHASTSHDNVDP
jgi:hypothetical protein